MIAMGAPQRITPAQGVLGALHITAGFISWIHDELKNGDLKPAEAKQLSLVEAEERERLAKFSKLAADMGVAERAQQLREQQTRQVRDLIEAVVNELKLNKTQKAKLGPALRRHIAELQEQNGNGKPSISDLVPEVSKMRRKDRRELLVRAKAREQ